MYLEILRKQFRVLTSAHVRAHAERVGGLGWCSERSSINATTWSVELASASKQSFIEDKHGKTCTIHLSLPVNVAPVVRLRAVEHGRKASSLRLAQWTARSSGRSQHCAKRKNKLLLRAMSSITTRIVTCIYVYVGLHVYGWRHNIPECTL